MQATDFFNFFTTVGFAIAFGMLLDVMFPEVGRAITQLGNDEEDDKKETGASFRRIAGTFYDSLFVKFLGERVFSFRFIFRTAILSLFFVFIALVLKTRMFQSSQGVISESDSLHLGSLALIWVAFLVGNVFADWLSLVQTRTIVYLAARARDLKDALIASLADVLVTLNLFVIGFSFFSYLSIVVAFGIANQFDLFEDDIVATTQVAKLGRVDEDYRYRIATRVENSKPQWVGNNGFILQVEGTSKNPALDLTHNLRVESYLDIEEEILEIAGYGIALQNIGELFSVIKEEDIVGFSVTWEGATRPFPISALSFDSLLTAVDELEVAPIKTLFGSYERRAVFEWLGLSGGFGSLYQNVVCLETDNFWRVDAALYASLMSLDPNESEEDSILRRVHGCTQVMEDAFGRYDVADIDHYYLFRGSPASAQIDLSVFFLSSFFSTFAFYFALFANYLFVSIRMFSGSKESKVVSAISRAPMGASGLLIGVLAYIGVEMVF